MVGGVRFEHTHRMIAEGVGSLTILFCIAAFRVDRRKWLRNLSLGAIATVIAQGGLGGITVLMFLPWYVSSAHAALGQTFFSIAVLLAVYTGRGWTESVADINLRRCHAEHAHAGGSHDLRFISATVLRSCVSSLGNEHTSPLG